MLDINFIRQNPELVRKGSEVKNFPVDIDQILTLDSEIRPKQTELENLQAERNRLSKQMKGVSPEEREEIRKQGIACKDSIEQLQSEIREKRAVLDELMLHVAQPARSDVPVGKDDAENIEVRKWGTPPQFSFKPMSHVELGEKLDIIDIPRGVKLAGSRSYVLKGLGAQLEQAILRYTYDYLLGKGYTAMSVPVLVNEDAMTGTGYFPNGKEQAYWVEKDQLALVGTSEVALCSLHGNEMFQESDLPFKYMAWSSCFRREAGTYGKDTKGLYRVHQFQKIEMVIVAPANQEQSDALHDELLGHAEAIVQALELPYRVVYVCTGDLGQGQVRKHDIETWMPSRDSYGETHSCSTFYDFQARRLKMRYKDSDGNKHFAYTFNNTACASPRLLIPLLENHQTKDGRIRIPVALRPYLNNREYVTT